MGSRETQIQVWSNTWVIVTSADVKSQTRNPARGCETDIGVKEMLSLDSKVLVQRTQLTSLKLRVKFQLGVCFDAD